MNPPDEVPLNEERHEETRDPLLNEDPGDESHLGRRVMIAVSVGVLLTAGLGLLSWEMSRLAAQDADQIVHTYQTSRRLQLTLCHADDLETGTRGFALTGIDQFLEPYDSGKKALARDLVQLPTLITDNPVQHQRLLTLTSEIDSRLEASAAVIAARRASGQVPSVELLLQGKHVMDALRLNIRDMDREERRLLDERTRRTERRRRLTSTAIGLGSFLGVVFLTVAGVVIRRGLLAASRAEDKVRALNADLEQRVQQRTSAFEAEALARQKTEAKLSSSEELFRNLLDGINDYAIYMLDADGCVATWNAGAARITGYTAEEILGRHVSTFHPAVGEYEQHARESLETAAQTGRSEEEALRVRKDGSTFWANAVITSLYDADERLTGYSKVMRDISARKRTDEDLRKQAKLLELAHDAIIVRDTEACIVYWNRGAEQMYGWSAEEAVGQTVHSLLQTVFPVALEDVEKTLRSEGEWEGELRHTTRSGAVIVVTSRMSMQRDEHCEPTATMEINRDITDHKQAEEIRERMAAIVNYSTDAIMSKTLDGTVTDWNHGAEKLFGYTAAEVIGKPMGALMPAAWVEEELEMLACIGRGENLDNFETVAHHKDGTQVYISVAFSPIRDGRGNIVGASKVARDVTQRRQAEEVLHEKEHLLSESQRIALIGSWTSDLADSKGTLVWSDELYRMYGVDRETFEPTMESLIERVFPDDRAALRIWLEDCAAGKKPVDLEFRLQMADGSMRYFSRRGELKYDSENRPIRITGTTQDITERKQGLHLLRESEEKFQNMVNCFPQLAWMADGDGSIFWYNQQFYDYTGTTIEEMQGWGWQRLHDPDTLVEVMDKWPLAIREGKLFDMEIPLLGAKGTFRTFLVRGTPSKDATGRVTRWYGTNTDITERKQNEERLARQAEELAHSRVELETQKLKLQCILDSLEEGLVAIDEQGKFILWNPAARRISGMDSADMSPEDWSSHYGIFLPDRVTPFPNELNPLVRGLNGEVSSVVMYLRNPQLEKGVLIEANGGPLRDMDGKSRGAVFAFRDITQRKADELQIARSRQELETQKLLLQSILDSLEEGLIAMDEQGKFLLWNPAAGKIIGMDSADMSPEAWASHYGSFLPDMVTPFPSEQHPLVRAAVGETSSAVMYLRNRGLGRAVWLEINGAPLRDAEGNPRGGVIAFRDITQRKADELEIRKLNEDLEERIGLRTAQLETANKELQAFTYSVSHDLRAPLRHINGFSRILVSEFGESLAPEARSHLQRIQDAVTRMGLLVDGLLALAKLGRQALKLQPNELNAMVEQVISMLQPECEGRDVEWRVAALPALDCDRILITQVFQNLLGNALKYSRGRSKAVIEVDSIQHEGKPAVIFVRDNGAGFNMQYATKLFEVFQRMHTESEFEGTGVGLATVYRIVQKHGGSIWAEAQMGQGATFFFNLGASEQMRLAPKEVAAGV